MFVLVPWEAEVCVYDTDKYKIRLHFILIVHFRHFTNYEQLCHYMSTNSHYLHLHVY